MDVKKYTEAVAKLKWLREEHANECTGEMLQLIQYIQGMERTAAHIAIAPWEDGTLGRSLGHAKPAPQELQDKVNASLKEGK